MQAKRKRDSIPATGRRLSSLPCGGAALAMRKVLQLMYVSQPRACGTPLTWRPRPLMAGRGCTLREAAHITSESRGPSPPVASKDVIAQWPGPRRPSTPAPRRTSRAFRKPRTVASELLAHVAPSRDVIRPSAAGVPPFHVIQLAWQARRGNTVAAGRYRHSDKSTVAVGSSSSPQPPPADDVELGLPQPCATSGASPAGSRSCPAKGPDAWEVAGSGVSNAMPDMAVLRRPQCAGAGEILLLVHYTGID
eukprot:scaffold2033_cov367-Prasinococcus_capsulatus_cf.AAC.9